ncbi:hypothetical protein [Kurthia massiliensis]|uniref:hypothetical protein n=1 Tax=Kurthia massiliensis TaxID=1033739 RepID=UPI000287AC35|nr:hypothetical protein [Kurthia massiliensis]
MEGLIIFIVTALLSYFFSGDKKDKQEKMPQQKSKGNGRFGSFMDTVKTQIEKIDDETKPLSKRQEQAKKVAQQAKRRAASLETQANEAATTLATRAEKTHERALKKVEHTRNDTSDVAPLKSVAQRRVKKQHPLLRTQEDLRRAVVLAEVLGPPKSKRK